MLYIIGLGLWDEKDISLKGLEIVKKADYVYLENYTSKLNCNVDDLEKLYGKKITLADREMVESGQKILEKAKENNVALLIIGDIFSATTHISLVIEARKKGIKVNVVHNASVVSAIGFIGLEVYKFGKITSIPFENKAIKSPVEALKGNKELGLHTLFLLDLRPKESRFMTVAMAAEYLLDNSISENETAVGIAGLGSENPGIVVGDLKSIAKSNKLKKFPQCLVVPGKMHFVEEEALKLWEKV